MGHTMKLPDPLFITPALRDYLCEPPLADPHEGLCGGWGVKNPRLPDWVCDISIFQLLFQKSWSQYFQVAHHILL